MVYNGNQVPEEFVETQYYKDLNSVDKHHHTVFSPILLAFFSEYSNCITNTGIHYTFFFVLWVWLLIIEPVLLFNGVRLYIFNANQSYLTDHLDLCFEFTNNRSYYMINMCASPTDGNRVHQSREKWQMLPHRSWKWRCLPSLLQVQSSNQWLGSSSVNWGTVPWKFLRYS